MLTGSISYNRTPGQQFVASGISTLTDQTNGYVSAGYLFSKRLAVGLDLGVNYRFYEISQPPSFNFPYETRLVQTEIITMPGIFVRWNFPLSDKLILFLEPGYGLGLGKNHSTYYLDPSTAPNHIDGSSTTNTIRLRGGLNYFITGRFALECTPGLVSWSNKNPDSGDSTSGVETSIGLRNLTFGFVFFLGGIAE